MSDHVWSDRPTAEVRDLSKQYTFFNWSPQATLQPRVIAGGSGATFWDTDGNRYLDFASDQIGTNAGHQHPRIVQAIVDQAQELTYVTPGATSRPRAELGRLLAELTPGRLTKSFFTNGGADAIENALKVAKFYTGRKKFIATYRSYHGNTHGASSVSGESRRWATEPGIPGVIHAPAPYCYRCDLGHEPKTCGARCARYIESLIEYEGPGNVAAVVVEGIIGANGVLLPERGDYLTTIREICTRYGVLMIVDEIMTGFGRTGEWFAVDHWGVEPDIMVLAKGLTGCHIPLGAVIVSDEIAERLDAEQPLMVGLTYSGYPLACAAAIAAIGVYRDERLVENARAMGARISERVPKLRAAHPSIGDMRGRGLFWFVELVKNRETKEQFGLSNMRTIAGKGLVQDVVNEAAKRGVHIMGHPLGFMVAPPLCITAEELDFGLDTIEEVLSAVTDPVCESTAMAGS